MKYDSSKLLPHYLSSVHRKPCKTRSSPPPTICTTQWAQTPNTNLKKRIFTTTKIEKPFVLFKVCHARLEKCNLFCDINRTFARQYIHKHTSCRPSSTPRRVLSFAKRLCVIFLWSLCSTRVRSLQSRRVSIIFWLLQMFSELLWRKSNVCAGYVCCTPVDLSCFPR